MSGDPSTTLSEPVESGTGDGTASPPADVEELLADLEELGDAAESAAIDEEIETVKALLATAHERDLIESGVRHLQPNDAVEAFVGSVIFATPLLVEDGVFDIAAHLFEVTVAGVPVFLIANTLFVVFMTYALLEWTGREREETRNLLGVIPVRVVMILAVSFVVAAGLMTVWGRVGAWRPPTEAIARINVIWTVGSLGAALGDILSGDAPSPAVAAEPPAADRLEERGIEPQPEPEPEPPGGASEGVPVADSAAGEGLTDAALVAALHDRFDALEVTVSTGDLRREVQRIRDRTNHAAVDTVFGDHVRKYTSRDVAEAFVGSIFFSIPFLVEDGVFDVADYFLSFQLGRFPVYFLVNAGFVLLMVTALVYWAGPQNVRVSRPLFGFVPRRLVGIAVVSFLTVAALMTMWGRVGGWREPVVAVARISVVWTVASFGAALGDILPGESSGDDINDDLADLGEQLEDLVE